MKKAGVIECANGLARYASSVAIARDYGSDEVLIDEVVNEPRDWCENTVRPQLTDDEY